MNEFYVIIPARLESRRFPNKPLQKLAGKPLIQHIYENAKRCRAQQVWVATDSDEIADCVSKFNGEVCITSSEHHSGTDRVAQAAARLGCDLNSIIVNVQGDELFLSPEAIDCAAAALESSGADIATLATRLPQEKIADRDIVKVVCNGDNMALYFSRASIPHCVGEHGAPDSAPDSALVHRRHLGIYAYRREYLEKFRRLPVATLEKAESLEQLRALTYGHKIFVKDIVSERSVGVDTPEDLIEAEKLLC